MSRPVFSRQLPSASLQWMDELFSIGSTCRRDVWYHMAQATVLLHLPLMQEGKEETGHLKRSQSQSMLAWLSLPLEVCPCLLPCAYTYTQTQSHTHTHTVAIRSMRFSVIYVSACSSIKYITGYVFSVHWEHTGAGADGSGFTCEGAL